MAPSATSQRRGLGRTLRKGSVPWACPEARALFEANPHLVDALDDIVRVARAPGCLSRGRLDAASTCTTTGRYRGRRASRCGRQSERWGRQDHDRPWPAASAWSCSVDTLVIDLDPQGNATTGLGVWEPPFSVDHASPRSEPARSPASTDQRLAHRARFRPTAIGCRRHTGARLRVIPAPHGSNRGNDRLAVALQGCLTSWSSSIVRPRDPHRQRPLCRRPGTHRHRTERGPPMASARSCVQRIATRRGTDGPGLAGIAVNRLGRTRRQVLGPEHATSTVTSCCRRYIFVLRFPRHRRRRCRSTPWDRGRRRRGRG